MKKILFITIYLLSLNCFSQKTYTLTFEKSKIVDSLKNMHHDYNQMEKEFVEILNNYRSANNLSLVVRNGELDLFAEEQSNYMKKTNLCTHKRGDLSFQDRVNQYTKYNIQGENAVITVYSYCVVGDTIMSMSESIFDLWKNSPTHNKTMLNNNNNLKVGVSFIEDSDHKVYAIMVIAN